MNRLPLDRRAQIINALVEGNSIRSTKRMFNVHRDTIMRLLVEVGSGCATILNDEMRDLSCRRIQVDEIWAYVQKKNATSRQRMIAAVSAICGPSLHSTPTASLCPHTA
ncbi:MAG TPA: hypothetical protein VHS33_10100 [Sphingomicrobium sp.]|jgi:hypothetical protein|nr:hypothetical protein [Sphingomicrobium sp.]